MSVQCCPRGTRSPGQLPLIHQEVPGLLPHEGCRKQPAVSSGSQETVGLQRLRFPVWVDTKGLEKVRQCV